jgi:hypothetical protein
MRSDLEQLMEEHGHTGRLKIHNTLTRPHEDWQHGRGRITVDMMKAHLPPPSEDTLICICGPEAMQETAKKQLTALGFDVTKWASRRHLPSWLTSMTGRSWCSRQSVWGIFCYSCYCRQCSRHDVALRPNSCSMPSCPGKMRSPAATSYRQPAQSDVSITAGGLATKSTGWKTAEEKAFCASRSVTMQAVYCRVKGMDG